MIRVGKFIVEAFKTVALTLGFAAFVHAASMLAPESLSVRPIVWFAGAGGIGTLLIFGARYWPAVGLGWFLSYHFRSDLPFLTHFLMAAALTLTCWVVVKFLSTQKFDRSLSSPRDLVLLGVATVVGGLLNVAAISSILGIYADWGRFSQWLLSYVAGAVMVLPVTLSWLYGGSFGSLRRWAHFGVCLAVGILAIWISQRYSTAASGFHTFHYLPLMVWASLAFNVRGATAIMAIIHTFAYWSLIDLTGPVLIDQTNHAMGIAATQQYIILSGFTVLVLAALVDHRQEAAARLADREQRLTGVVETAEDGILVVDEFGLIDDMNPAALRMFGFDGLSETKGCRTDDILVGDRVLLGTHVKSARRKDGTEFPAQITVGKPWESKNGRKYTTKIVRDITKQRRAEAELLDREERYRAIVETAADGIIVINAKGIIQSFNNAAEAMFGFESGDAIGQPISVLLPEQAPHQNINGAVVEALRKDGSTFPAQLAIASWEVGGERFYTAITRDLTKQKASEEARDILAREVDHRAKNALAVVQSLVKLTRANNINDFIGAVSGRIEALARAHSLLSQTNWSGVSLLQIAEDELAATEKGVSINGSAIRMTPDAVQPISMLFHELSTNALKYGALRTPHGSVSLSWKVINKNLVIHWLENGPASITPPASFGFGSMMMKQVVTKQLQGTIDYDWRENGVSVTIVLPPCSFTKSAAMKKPRAPSAPVAPPSGHGKRVLIVEDNALIMMELEATLEENGYNVVGSANSVSSALGIINDIEIDVAVLDVDLNGVYSFPVADALVAKKVPFAFATGFETLTTEQGYNAPVLTKPVNAITLLKTFDSLLSNTPK